MECDKTYLWLECGVSMLPVFIFILAGIKNFCEIRGDGFNRVVQFSTLFKWKYRANLFMVLLNLLMLCLTFTDSSQYTMLNKCLTGEFKEKNLSVDIIMGSKNLINIVAWYGSYKLLIYQYRKCLSETWYSHQSFWFLNFLAQLYLLIYTWERNGPEKKYYNQFPQITGVSVCLTNLFIIVLMINTTKRTIERPRPADIHFTSDGNLIEQMDNG